jgi:alkylation response protein AidB-like acyl-CoA dehydrogenase
MNEIVFGKEQALLAGIAAKFFREKSSIEVVRDLIETETGFDEEVWGEMVDAGWNGMVIPEANGGIGFDMTELVTVVEPMGRHLFASPFLSSQLVIQSLLKGGEHLEGLRKTWLPRLAEGAMASLAVVEPDGDWDLENCRCGASVSGASVRLSGEKRFVLDAAVADLFAITVHFDGGPAIAFVDADRIPEGALSREVVIDETRRSYRLSLDGVELDPECLLCGPVAREALAAVLHAALLLISAEACGGAAGALEGIVEYLKSRIQFDRPIGSYQALKHPTVDVLIGLERARSHLYHAATVYGAPQAEVALRMAKAASSEAFAFAGDRAIQFHGGFGFTYECDAQLYLRRALWCQTQHGDPIHHRKYLAELLLEPSEVS